MTWPRVVTRFEEVGYDVVAGHGGRLVTTIGDAIMIAAVDPAAAVLRRRV
jgi:class 3 adenylate cyclase